MTKISWRRAILLVSVILFVWNTNAVEPVVSKTQNNFKYNNIIELAD